MLRRRRVGRASHLLRKLRLRLRHGDVLCDLRGMSDRKEGASIDESLSEKSNPGYKSRWFSLLKF